MSKPKITYVTYIARNRQRKQFSVALFQSGFKTLRQAKARQRATQKFLEENFNTTGKPIKWDNVQL